MKLENLQKVRANQLNNPTKYETDFANKLRKWNIAFEPQKITNGYIADFYLPQFNTIVEIDGHAHYKYGLKRDRRRDSVLRQAGYRIIRIRNTEVFDYEKEDLIRAANGIEQIASVPDKTFYESYLASL